MNVRNCRRCRKLFNYIMGPVICPNCREEMEAKFQEVKKYVQENARCGMREVSEACDVSVNQIQQWLREERLVLSEESSMGLGCERCGKMIRSGRFCPECKAEMTHSFRGAMGNPTPAAPTQRRDTRDSARMRFLDK